MLEHLVTNHEDLIGLQVRVYRNLHRGCLSIQHGGRVVAHVNNITLDGVTFKVSQAGRQRCLREKRKNVHAYVVGTVVSLTASAEGIPVRYNPYQMDSFQVDGAPVHASQRVSIGKTGIRVIA